MSVQVVKNTVLVGAKPMRKFKRLFSRGVKKMGTLAPIQVRRVNIELVQEFIESRLDIKATTTNIKKLVRCIEELEKGN